MGRRRFEEAGEDEGRAVCRSIVKSANLLDFWVERVEGGRGLGVKNRERRGRGLNGEALVELPNYIGMHKRRMR